jgi:hypothetical protein
MDFIAQGRVDVESLISHEIPLDEGVAEWFSRLTAPGSGAVKVLVKIAGDAGFGIRDSGFGIRNSGFGIRNSR